MVELGCRYIKICLAYICNIISSSSIALRERRWRVKGFRDPASVDNFYDLGIKAFNSEKKLAFKEGSIGYQLTNLAEFPIPNFIAYKKHLISKGASEDLATCIIRRDMLFVFGIQYMEGTKILYEYPPSPVPAVWMYRSIHSNILSYISQPSTQPWRNVFEKVSKKCEPFKYMGPSSDLIEKFSF